MNDDPLPHATIQFRVTVGAEDAPALFRALHGVKVARRRVHRFRELAIKGLLLEQLGVQALAPQRSDQAIPESARPDEPSGVRTFMSVAEQLSWGDE